MAHARRCGKPSQSLPGAAPSQALPASTRAIYGFWRSRAVCCRQGLFVVFPPGWFLLRCRRRSGRLGEQRDLSAIDLNPNDRPHNINLPGGGAARLGRETGHPTTRCGPASMSTRCACEHLSSSIRLSPPRSGRFTRERAREAKYNCNQFVELKGHFAAAWRKR